MQKTAGKQGAPAEPDRAGRRDRSRRAILTAARELFSELGYEQTTIRSVAHRAGIDPALVMKHFGSKEALFGAVSEISIGFGGALAGPPGERGERLLRHVLTDVENRPDRNLPVLRSMLTHPQAAEAVRCAVADPHNSALPDSLKGDDAELRAGLIGTVVLGLLVSRHLLRVPGVDRAAPELLVDLLGPCLQVLFDEDEARPAARARAARPGTGKPSGPAHDPAQPLRREPPLRADDPHGEGAAHTALARLADAEAARLQAVEQVDLLAREALADGASYADIGQLLGISRQAARKRWPRTPVDDGGATARE